MTACRRISPVILADDSGGPAWPRAADPAAAAMHAVATAADDPRTSDVRALVQRHLEFAAPNKPARDIHALDLADSLEPASGASGQQQP